jgi:C-terminal processing protease CtpA/Prc
VKVFATLLAANINGGSFLEQLDQAGDLFSILRDRDTNEITEGSLLIFAEDDQQAFPSSVGDDGLLFTEDDPTAPLQEGYTIARLAADGTITFDRSRDGRMDIIQQSDAAWPDFSDMGLVESYNALIDLLAEEYAFTELRDLDWEEIRATYLPLAEAALEARSVEAWDAALRTLAQSIRDAHVVSNGPGLALFEQPIAANLGANGVELSDGRIVVGAVAPGSSLDEAGIVLGSEIVSIDGQTVEERLPTVIYSDATGTEEGKRLRQVRNLLRFPAGAEVELGYRLPDTDEVQTATLTAGAWPLGNPLATPRGVQEITYDMLDKFFGYVTWKDFQDPIPTVDTYKDFLRLLNARQLTPSLIQSPGIIVDMRSNGGGWKTQYLTMGSYLFSQENPVAYNWSENASFNAETGTWDPIFEPDWMLSAPDLAAYFPGEVVLLIDPSCDSSCEFFAAFLQSSGRATVVGEYASNGAGGPIKRASMPGGFVFQYPYQGALFTGTDELVLEAKGIVPDVRVPITIDSEVAKSQGSDPVLETALQVLKELSGQALAGSIVMAPFDDPQGQFTAVAPEGWSAQGSIFTSPANSEFLVYLVNRPPTDIEAAEYVSGLMGAPVDEDNVLGEREANGLTWTIYSSPVALGGLPFVRRIALASDDAGTYVVAATTLDYAAEAALEALLYPAIDAFTLTPSQQ